MRISGYLIAVLALCLTIAAFLFLYREGVPGSGNLIQILQQQGQIAVVGSDDLMRLRTSETELTPLQKLPVLQDALAQQDSATLLKAMVQTHINGLLVGGDPQIELVEEATLGQRLTAYRYIPGLKVVWITPAAIFYKPNPEISLDEKSRKALAGVARGLLAGATPPQMSSFPESLRSLHHVEVMVMLRQGTKRRLWRSARGSSIARALQTACLVARKRWNERQSVMGGELDAMLAQIDVEVSLLIDDGTFGVRERSFLERAVTSEHGIGYEYKGSWHYELPGRTRNSVVKTYERMFTEMGMPKNSWNREEMRLYRFVVQLLARSRGRKDIDRIDHSTSSNPETRSHAQ